MIVRNRRLAAALLFAAAAAAAAAAALPTATPAKRPSREYTIEQFLSTTAINQASFSWKTRRAIAAAVAAVGQPA